MICLVEVHKKRYGSDRRLDCPRHSVIAYSFDEIFLDISRNYIIITMVVI